MTKWGRRPHWHYDGLYLGADEHGDWLAFPVGTHYRRPGKDLTVDTFVKAIESIKGYRDIFNGPEVTFGPQKHQGANSSFLAVVKGGRGVRLPEQLSF